MTHTVVNLSRILTRFVCIGEGTAIPWPDPAELRLTARRPTIPAIQVRFGGFLKQICSAKNTLGIFIAFRSLRPLAPAS